MYCRHRPSPSVDQQDRNAIRSTDRKTETGDVRQEGVSFTHASFAPRHVEADVGMDLFEADDAGLPVPLIGVSRAETVLQPRDLKPGSGLKNVTAVPEKLI